MTIYSIAYYNSQFTVLACTDTFGALSERSTPRRQSRSGDEGHREPGQLGHYPTFFDRPDAGDLTGVFQQIGTQLTEINTRLIPTPRRQAVKRLHHLRPAAVAAASALCLTFLPAASAATPPPVYVTPAAMAAKIHGSVPQIPTDNTSAPSDITATTCRGMGDPRQA